MADRRGFLGTGDARARGATYRGPPARMQHHGGVPIIAALDLGTNNCRLLIARPEGEEFTIIDAYSRIVRLGEGLALTGELSRAAMARAMDALSHCADKLRRRRVSLSRSVATEACRQAVNGGEFIARVASETGILLDVINPKEEARLAVLGCHRLLSPGDGPALIFDIGGGSTELVLVDDGPDGPVIRDWLSLPWGVVSLTEAERHADDCAETRAAAYGAMRARARSGFAEFAARIAPLHGGLASCRLLGTSGTVTTLASMHLQLPSYDRSRVDGLIVESADFLALCQGLAMRSLAERETLPCIGRERADLVVAGCAILHEICAIWPSEMLHVADRGVREGVLREMVRLQLSPTGTRRGR